MDSPDRELDAALVAAARGGGDPAAYATLVRRHLPAAYAVARAVVLEPADAEDVCQEVFAALYARLDACRPASSFRPWLLASVRNRAISLRRRQRVRAAAVLGSAPWEHDPADPAEGPLADVERADLRARLAAAVATLPEAQRTTVLLHDVEGWRHREVAAVLGVAEGTSRATLFAARRRLRTLLAAVAGTRPAPALAARAPQTIAASDRPR